MVRGIVLTLLGVTATLWPTEPSSVRPLQLSGPHRAHTLVVVPGPRLEPHRVGHMGAPHPAHAALEFAAQTWIGTHSAGLLRYGPRWSGPRRVSVQQGLPSAQINDLLPDGTALLVATGGGVARVDAAGSVTHVLLRGQSALALGRGFGADNSGPPLVATRRGLYRLGADSVKPVPGLNRVTVHRMATCGDWLYLVGSSTLALSRGGQVESLPLPLTRGLACAPLRTRARPRRSARDHILRAPLRTRARPRRSARGAGEPLWSAEWSTPVGARGGAWAATALGLWRVQGVRVEATGFEHHATAVEVLSSGRLVFGTFGDGAFVEREPGGALTRLRHIVPRGKVSLVRALSNAILVGTDQGLYLARDAGGSPDEAPRRLPLDAQGSPDEAPRRLPLDGPPPGPVVGLALAGSDLWAGTFDAGLGLWRGGRWQRVPLFDERITALARGPNGRIWVGTQGGLGVQTHPGSRRFQRVVDTRGWLERHISMVRLEGQQLWVGVYPGLMVLEVTRGVDPRPHYLEAGLPGTTINAVVPTASGLWAGGESGIRRLTGGTSHALTDLDPRLPDNWINDVRREGDTIQVLTLDAGLLQIAPHGSRTLVAHLMTSPSGLLLLHHRPLFGTGRGLAVVDGTRVLTFGPAQGQACSSVTALLHDVKTDRLWLGGDAGVTWIDGAGAMPGPSAPPHGSADQEDT